MTDALKLSAEHPLHISSSSKDGDKTQTIRDFRLKVLKICNGFLNTELLLLSDDFYSRAEFGLGKARKWMLGGCRKKKKKKAPGCKGFRLERGLFTATTTAADRSDFVCRIRHDLLHTTVLW